MNFGWGEGRDLVFREKNHERKEYLKLDISHRQYLSDYLHFSIGTFPFGPEQYGKVEFKIYLLFLLCCDSWEVPPPTPAPWFKPEFLPVYQGCHGLLQAR